MEAIVLITRLVLFGVFALAGVGKLLDLSGSEKAMKAFGVPEPFSKPFSILIPFAELVFAACFLFVSMSWEGAIGTLLLLVSFIGGMIWQIREGNAPDCHCFGQIHSEPVGWSTLLRNFALAGLCALLILLGPERQGLTLGQTNAQIATNAALATVLVGFVVVGSYLKRLVVENGELKHRVELLETFQNGGHPVSRDEAGNPDDSLPIGAPFPDFELPDTGGKLVTFEHLLADFVPKVIVFVGPTCEPCKGLIPSFEKWRNEFDGRIRFVFVSTGGAAENIERFGSDLSKGMLLQTSRELAKKVYANWTPAAIFVAADGHIASHPAVGDLAINDLVARLQSEDFTDTRFFIANNNKRGRVKIGQKVPDFSLPDIKGNVVTPKFFEGKPTLAVFLSTTCSFCAVVIDEIKAWENSPERNGTNLIVFSDGDLETHQSFGIESPLVLDKGYRFSHNLGMYGVPSALLVDENGVVVSETATGGPFIWSLLGKFDK